MEREKKITLRAGFEPAREVPIGFQVQRLNHSAIVAACISMKTSGIKVWQEFDVLLREQNICYRHRWIYSPRNLLLFHFAWGLVCRPTRMKISWLKMKMIEIQSLLLFFVFVSCWSYVTFSEKIGVKSLGPIRATGKDHYVLHLTVLLQLTRTLICFI